MKATVAAIALLGMMLGTQAASAQGFRSGKWTVGFGQGMVEHTVRNGPGNEFMILCDTGATEDAERTGLSITIRDRGAPSSNGEIRIFVDDEELTFFEDKDGILINNRAAQSNFDVLWEALRKGRSMRVLLADGRTSTFSLEGVRKALGPKACETGFTGRMPAKTNAKR
ncbi:hypothetical protein IC232_03855 [Microvirga sp. BT688]|uniref:hypothetical protein n=1 Tax=Microvirga sp. TaxID=1873136 RepID=UPI0016840D51|nr:hypothetical protein [Microvirga sp.]MBD2745826.1 hypothetical protein [Microvirga sp.]